MLAARLRGPSNSLDEIFLIGGTVPVEVTRAEIHAGLCCRTSEASFEVQATATVTLQNTGRKWRPSKSPPRAPGRALRRFRSSATLPRPSRWHSAAWNRSPRWRRQQRALLDSAGRVGCVDRRDARVQPAGGLRDCGTAGDGLQRRLTAKPLRAGGHPRSGCCSVGANGGAGGQGSTLGGPWTRGRSCQLVAPLRLQSSMRR